MLKIRQQSDVTKFELQARLYHELLACGLDVRGGIKVVCGDGSKSIDVAVMRNNVVTYAIMVSSANDTGKPENKAVRDARYQRNAVKLSSLGCPATVVCTLKEASDLVCYVRKNKTLPPPTHAAVTRISGAKQPPTENQMRSLKQLAATRRHPFSQAELNAMSSRDVRQHIRSLQMMKPIKCGPCSQELNLADADNPEWLNR